MARDRLVYFLEGAAVGWWLLLLLFDSCCLEPWSSMGGDSKTPVALALDAAGLAEAEARREEAGASIVGSGSLSSSPAEGAVGSSANLVR